jgi:hypothetical protein
VVSRRRCLVRFLLTHRLAAGPRRGTDARLADDRGDHALRGYCSGSAGNADRRSRRDGHNDGRLCYHEMLRSGIGTPRIANIGLHAPVIDLGTEHRNGVSGPQC